MVVSIFLRSQLTLRLCVRCSNYGFDVTANVKIALDLDAERLTRLDEILENDVYNVLMENLYISKAINVELQALQLDAKAVRDVAKLYDCKVGKVGERTDCRELGHLKFYPNLFSNKFVRKRIERKKIHRVARRGNYVEPLIIGAPWRVFV